MQKFLQVQKKGGREGPPWQTGQTIRQSPGQRLPASRGEVLVALPRRGEGHHAQRHDAGGDEPAVARQRETKPAENAHGIDTKAEEGKNLFTHSIIF